MLGLADLQQHINRGKLLPFYIFTGEEIELQNIYLRQMGEVDRVDNVASIYKKLCSKTLWGATTNKIYVVRDDTDFIKTEKAWTDIPNKIKNGTLVIQLTTMDKRSKFVKSFEKDYIVEFQHMSLVQLQRIVKNEGMEGTNGLFKYFIESCKYDYNTILNYIDIFKRLEITQLSKQIIDDIIPHKDEIGMFDLPDALMRKDSQQCYYLLDALLADPNTAVPIIYAIYNQLHKCVLVEGYRESNNIAKDTGINGWICRNILEQNKITPNNLLKSLRLVQKYDKGIKQGKYNSVDACYCLVTEILTL